MSIFNPEYVSAGLEMASRLRIGSEPLVELSRDELLALAAHQAQLIRELQQSSHYTHRVAMAANEEQA